MAGNAIGGRKGAATRLGLSLEAYDARLAAGERHCFLCGRWRPEDLFNRNARSGHGRQNHCRDCIRGYMRDYMRLGVKYVAARD